MREGSGYDAPQLTPLPFLAFAKHQARPILPTAGVEDGVDIAKLVEQYGSPLFVVSERRLRRDFRDFRDAFTEPGLKTQIGYSVKTNYLPAIVSIAREEGAWAEVVSGMEYDLARALGAPGEEIIFNGPHKTREELEKAIGEGAIVNVDNFAELDLVTALARALGKTARIGLRFSFQYGDQPWTKFGFNDENGDSQQALEKIAAREELDLVLLHNHCGTFVLVHDLYAAAADRMIGIARRARKLGLRPTMADFGGGFPSRNSLKPEFDLPGGSRRAGNFWLPYGEILCRRLMEAKELFGGHPTLVLEPGRAVVDGCTRLAATVVASKRIPGHGEALIVDAGVNLVPTACYYDHDLVPVDATGNGDKSRPGRPIEVLGPLCMQSDRLRSRAALPGLAVGDHLVIGNVGAYCHTQSMQFIQTRPATVMVGQDGIEVIRRRESWRDVFALDHLPDRLRADGCSF